MEKSPPKQVKASETAPALRGVPQNPELHNHNLYAEGLGWTHAGALVVGSVSVSLYESRFADSVGVLWCL